MNQVYEMPYLESVRNYSIRHFQIPLNISHIRLFHGTSTVFLDRILERGLLTCSSSGEMIDEGDWASEPNLVYLGHSYRCFFEYASRTVRKKGGQKILIEVEVPISWKLIDDFQETRGESKYRDWRDCLEHFLICAHEGNLMPENIVAVHFFNPFLMPVNFGNVDHHKRIDIRDINSNLVQDTLNQLSL